MRYGHTICIAFILIITLQGTAYGGYVTAIKRRISVLLSELSKQQKAWGPMAGDCDMCVWGSCRPTINALPEYEFHLAVDTEHLFRTLRKFSPDRYLITDILTSRSESQRKSIGDSYRSRTHVRLAKAIGDKLLITYRHTELVVALATPLPDFFANKAETAYEHLRDIHKKDGGVLAMIEIFTSLAPCLVQRIISVYNGKNGKDSFVSNFVDALKDTEEEDKWSDDFIDVMAALAENKRNRSPIVSWFQALKDARRMRIGIESGDYDKAKVAFKEVFTTRSIPQLKETILVYEDLRTGSVGFKSMITDIIIVMGDLRHVYTNMVKSIKNQPMYFASLFDALFATQTNANNVAFMHLLRERADIDLQDIIDAYNERYQDFETALGLWETSRKHFYEAVIKVIKQPEPKADAHKKT